MNHWAVDYGPKGTEDVFADAPQVNLRESIDLVFMGNSAMYHNIGFDNVLINEILSDKLGRPINVKFVSAGGVKGDWISLMLKEYVVQNWSDIPIVWFIWTGLPFEPMKTGEPEESSTSEEEKFDIGTWLQKNVYAFQISKDTQAESKRFILNTFYDFLHPHISNTPDTAKKTLNRIFQKNDPFADFLGPAHQRKTSKKQTVREARDNFDTDVENSSFPGIVALIKRYNLDFYMLEVTTQNQTEKIYDSPLRFSEEGFDFDIFDEYRNKQNKLLKKYDIPLVSLLKDPRISKDMFGTNVYLNKEHYRMYAELIADMLLSKNVIE